uniref:P53-induced death domain-containing protein 1-like n=3 Tax=Ciona intestinalis TaxID=7719 RepID=F6X1J7_CIOIN
MLMCRHFDKSQFRLLKCPCSSTEWQDVTDNIEMTFSQTDVKFNVNSFSKFWLVWRNVCGVARLVYHRLHTCKVQFIAMQKSSQPTSVFTQCVKSQYTQRTVAKLKQRGYFGDPACTQVKELTEGDQFKIKIIGDIRLDAHTDAYRKHLEEKVLIGRFHKQFHPDEDGYQSFPISAKNPKVTEVVHGHATFYQIIHPDCEESFLPSNPPIQQSSLKRSHNDSNGDVTEEHCDVTDASIQQQ